MGLIVGLIKIIFTWSLYLLAFVSLIVLIPNLPPHTSFTSYELEPTQPKFKTLDHCTSLNNPQHILKDNLNGPESFTIVNGELLTSLATGEVVKVSANGAVNIVTKIGKPCLGEWDEETCGRPLSIQYSDKEDKLYILDAYYGIWKVDLKTDKKQLLVSPTVKIEGRTPMLMNSMALDANGDIYWTASSSDFKLHDGTFTIFSDPSGRLFHYDAAKNQSRVVLDNLNFANGVAISPNREFVVVSESFGLRLMKYYINGNRKGHKEVFASGLPGCPDNIQPLPDRTGMLVGMYTMFDDHNPLLIRSMAKAPIIRKFAARILRGFEILLEYVNSYYPHVILEKMIHQIGNFKYSPGLAPPLTGLLRLDWNGNIVHCFVNTDKQLGPISDAVVYNNMLYLGSPHSPYIATVPVPANLMGTFKTSTPSKSSPGTETKPIPKEVPQQKVQSKPVEQKPTMEPPKVEAKPQTQVPKQAKPTVKPPKPTTEAPKRTETKPTTQPPKPVDSKPKPVESKPKPAENKPKPVESKPKPAENKPKPVESKPAPTAQPAKAAESKSKPTQSQPTPVRKEQIPIKEEIPSDTAKPPKETLKVIKKSGPTEIPNPHV